MRKVIGVLLGVLWLSGCTGGEQVVLDMRDEELGVTSAEVEREQKADAAPRTMTADAERVRDVVRAAAENVGAIGQGGPDLAPQDGGDEVTLLQEIAPLTVTDHLISWGFEDEERGKGEIDTVVIHSVYNPLKGDAHDFESILSIFKGYGVAPHYIIERDGRVTRLVRERNSAYHAGRSRTPDGRTNVNAFSIGVEMIASLDDTYTDAQYGALRSLVHDLSERYALKYVLGHDEIEVEDPWNFDWGRLNQFRHAPR